MKCSILTLCLTAVIFSKPLNASLTLSGVKCGSKTCQPSEYCSEYDHQCLSCSLICNNKTHNFDANVCVRDCQDFLHDIRYVKKNGIDSSEEDIKAEVQKLHYMVAVTLTLTCLALTILSAMILFQLCFWMKTNHITLASLRSKYLSKDSKTSTNKSTANGINEQVIGKPDLRLAMPTPGTQSEHSPATVTTTISRRPAEDSALDYAYDNPAMSTTPSPQSKPHESSF